MITFYAQGAFNLCLAVYSWAVDCFPSQKIKPKKWVDELFDTLVFGSTAAGYALCIAAFSQWSSITIYHLFLCYTFSGAISVANPSVKIDRLRSVRPLVRIRGSYFLGYQLTLIAINCVTIYRFNLWENTAGNALSSGSTGLATSTNKAMPSCGSMLILRGLLLANWCPLWSLGGDGRSSGSQRSDRSKPF